MRSYGLLFVGIPKRPPTHRRDRAGKPLRLEAAARLWRCVVSERPILVSDPSDALLVNEIVSRLLQLGSQEALEVVRLEVIQRRMDLRADRLITATRVSGPVAKLRGLSVAESVRVLRAEVLGS